MASRMRGGSPESTVSEPSRITRAGKAGEGGQGRPRDPGGGHACASARCDGQARCMASSQEE
eukprot:9592403-Lingulodinium_polyedra.AAC.1